MELRHLRYFVAVAEAENVSRAALRLHVSQPALSRQIRDLEEELGFALLERTAKSVRMTEAGRVFLRETRAVLARAELAVTAARAVARGNDMALDVGYAPTLAARVMPAALREFQRAQPLGRVKLHDLSSREMLAALREGKLDLAVTVRPEGRELRGLVFEELVREPLRLAMAPSHRLARRRRVELSDAVEEKFVSYSRAEYPEYDGLLKAIFERTGKLPRIAEEHDGVSSLISAVESGAGVAVVPSSLSCLTPRERLNLRLLWPDPEPLIVGLIVLKRSRGAVVEEFAAALRRVV